MAVFDTNIVIDASRGIPQALDAIERSEARHISIITWIEAMAGNMPEAAQPVMEGLLANFTVHPVGHDIAVQAASIRRTTRLKMPDAVIWATAKWLRVPLIARDSKDFPEECADITIPYRLQ